MLGSRVPAALKVCLVAIAILDDLVAITQPRFMRLLGDFYVRGGITTKVTAEFHAPNWKPLPTITLP